MNLYKSVYWTKRVFVVFLLVLFICGGVRIFQFVSRKFSNTQLIGNNEQKAELGFGKIDRITLTPLSAEGFSPKTFTDFTSDGKLFIDNKYPTNSISNPVANVYKIIEKPISIQTREIPISIAKNLKFASEPIPSSSTTTSKWQEGNRRLDINGQYLNIFYENIDQRNKLQQFSASSIDLNNETNLESYFAKALSDMGITLNIKDYALTAEYVNYDSTNNRYVATPSLSERGLFIRINASRIYNSITKVTKDLIPTKAVYPNYVHSNNYLIIPASLNSNEGILNNTVAFSLYNWSLLQQNTSSSGQYVQTYNIKTPKQAYQELTKNNQYLISASIWNTKSPINPNDLAGIDKVAIHRISINLYEDTINTGFIQPVYVFVGKVEKEDKQYEVVYYIPAVLDKNLNN